MNPPTGNAAIPDASTILLDDAIGQVLCFGWEGPGCETINDHARELVEEMRVGGVILLARNIATPDAVRAMLMEMQGRSGVPLLVAVDQEGGRVNRFGPPFAQFPGNMALGACGDDGAALAEQQARAQAVELRSVGVNWNLAPVLDVNNNPHNPVIGIRSYGEDPERVGALGVAAINGYRAGGVLACAKHFPGHGNTTVDSHIGLPVVDAPRAALDAVELVPFRMAIAARVPAIMTTHIVFPSLDYCLPATLSASILTDLLREQLGHDGVIITDCLEMAAIAETIGTPHGAVAALSAGADMVLVCHTLETQRETVRAIRQAVQGGILDEARLREAAARVLRMKALIGAPASGPGVLCDWPSHRDLEACIARASVTVARDGGRLPLARGTRVCVASTDPACRVVTDRLSELGMNATWRLLDRKTMVESPSETVARALEADVAVVAAGVGPADGIPGDTLPAFVRRLSESMGDRMILVAAGSPYDLRLFPEAATAIAVYGNRDCSLTALADALAGLYPPTGRLPVSL